MQPELNSRCDLFIENRELIKSEFRWESAYMYPLGAYILAVKNRRADAELLRECNDLLKAHTGVFSNFRGTSKMATITGLSLSSQRERKLNDILAIYDALKGVLGRSEFMTVIADMLVEMIDQGQREAVIQRTNRIYRRMKEEHPFLTSKEDSPYAALLAMSDRSEDELIHDMEACYDRLRNAPFSKNALQSLSHILALSNVDVSVKCDRVIELYQSLKANGHPYGKHYEISTMGILAMLDVDIAVLTREISEVDDFLKTKKGFGAFGIGAKQRLMYAGMLVSSLYAADFTSMQTAAVSGVMSLIIAQQAALCASMAAASAAAAASSSANS